MSSADVDSPRLQLRPYTGADLEDLFAVHADPRIGRHTFSPESREVAAERYEAAEAQRVLWGAAPWVARQEPGGDVIGYGGLLIDGFDPGWGVEIMYFIAPPHWGRGYATEIAAAAVEFAFQRLRLDRLVSFAHPKNHASNRVLEKVGFSFDRYLTEMNRNHYIMIRTPVGG